MSITARQLRTTTLTLAAEITRELFALGDEPDSKAHRIEFRGGYGATEVPQGGLSEDAMTKWLALALERHGVSNAQGHVRPCSEAKGA